MTVANRTRSSACLLPSFRPAKPLKRCVRRRSRWRNMR